MAGFVMRSGDLNRRISFERPLADDSFDGAGSGAWEPVVTVWANVQDALPSRGERLADGINISSRPARIRIRFRTDITADMRIIYGDRVMQIVGPPAELGRREGLEMMAVEESSPGGGA